ncbi:hypothetical protein ACJIZ3_001165 [Penstemon smallii]|uniref:Uncharacterized protein n=1 Tax=Penstemon smallii TaxID=265156 RepID=A0ABD3U3W2_9LAMI
MQIAINIVSKSWHQSFLFPVSRPVREESITSHSALLFIMTECIKCIHVIGVTPQRKARFPLGGGIEGFTEIAIGAFPVKLY